MKKISCTILLALASMTASARVWTMENQSLRLSFDDEAANFCVTDLRTGHEWRQNRGEGVSVRRVTQKNGLMIISLHGAIDFTLTAQLTDDAGLHMTLSAKKTAEMSKLSYPPAFSSNRTDDYLLMTDGEGLLLPVTDTTYPLSDGMIYFSGGGPAMPWLGVTDRALQEGYMVIADTPFEVCLQVLRQADGLLAVQPVWLPSMEQFGYNRKFTYYFFDSGGYVAQCKKYRERVWQEKPIQTLREKAKQKPALEKMLGAPHIYVWDDGRDISVARDMKSLGIDRALFLWDGNHRAYPEPGYDDKLKALGYATGAYTLFSDLHKRDTMVYVPDTIGPNRYVQSVYPGEYHTLAARKANGDTYHNQFGTYACPTVMQPKMRQRFNRELREYNHECMFLDVYQANGVYECYSPKHRATREDYARAIINNYRLGIDEYGFYMGGEWGADFVAPYSSYVHGMMTIQWPWWQAATHEKKGTAYYYGDWHNNERPTIMVSTSMAPPSYTDWSMNEVIRVPLYELVYHDVCVTSWRWEDANHHNPEIWWKKDLFNVLYGSAPLWSMDKARWEAFRLSLAESYHRVCPWLRKIAYDEMTNHSFVTEDHKVQRTDFSSGRAVIVNFSEYDYDYRGRTVKAKSYLEL